MAVRDRHPLREAVCVIWQSNCWITIWKVLDFLHSLQRGLIRTYTGIFNLILNRGNWTVVTGRNQTGAAEQAVPCPSASTHPSPPAIPWAEQSLLCICVCTLCAFSKETWQFPNQQLGEKNYIPYTCFYICIFNTINMLSPAKTANQTICKKDVWDSFLSVTLSYLLQRARHFTQFLLSPNVAGRHASSLLMVLHIKKMDRWTDGWRCEARTTQKRRNRTTDRTQETELPT